MRLSRELPGLTPAQREQVVKSMCCEGAFCGAADCYRCQGELALDSLEERFPEVFAEEESES